MTTIYDITHAGIKGYRAGRENIAKKEIARTERTQKTKRIDLENEQLRQEIEQQKIENIYSPSERVLEREVKTAELEKTQLENKFIVSEKAAAQREAKLRNDKLALEKKQTEQKLAYGERESDAKLRALEAKASQAEVKAREVEATYSKDTMATGLEEYLANGSVKKIQKALDYEAKISGAPAELVKPLHLDADSELINIDKNKETIIADINAGEGHKWIKFTEGNKEYIVPTATAVAFTGAYQHMNEKNLKKLEERVIATKSKTDDAKFSAAIVKITAEGGELTVENVAKEMQKSKITADTDIKPSMKFKEIKEAKAFKEKALDKATEITKGKAIQEWRKTATPAEQEKLRRAVSEDLRAYEKLQGIKNIAQEKTTIQTANIMSKATKDVTKLTPSETGLLDKQVFKWEQKLLDTGELDKIKGAAEYNAIMAVARKEISGAAVTEPEMEKFAESYGDLGDSAMVAFIKFANLLDHTKNKLQTVSQKYEASMADLRFGESFNGLDEAINRLRLTAEKLSYGDPIYNKKLKKLTYPEYDKAMRTKKFEQKRTESLSEKTKTTIENF